MISERSSWLSSSRARMTKSGHSMPWGFVAGGLALVVLSAGVSARVNRDLGALLDREDGEALEQAERTFDGLVDQKLTHLKSQVAVLAEDARIRSTVVTPEFDQTSVADVLMELKKSAHADILAILDAAGKVRAVTGADEMRNLDLGTSSLVKAGLDGPAAYVWTFTNKVRLLGVAPIVLGDQVLALFMIGFDLGTSSLKDIGMALGAAGGAFAGDVLVASSSAEASIRGVLQAAASHEAGSHELVHDARAFVARVSRPTRSAGAVKLVWVVDKHHEAARMGLLRWFGWAPLALVGLSFLLLLGLALRERARAT